MQQKNTIVLLGAVLMSAVLVGAGVVAAGVTDGGDGPQASIDQQTDGDDDRSITVTASGDVETEPDQAVVQLSVEATADDPSVARSAVAENATGMREALSELGIEDDQVRTTGFNIHEDRERPREPDAEPEVTYRARHQFEVELDDIDAVGDVIDTAIDGGATHVNGVEFTLAEDTRQELRQDALREAMDNARLEADTIAESADLSVSGVDSVTTDNVRFQTDRVRYAAMSESADAAARTSIEPGDVTVSATVNVEYDVGD